VKKRILIVDDDESILGACELTLLDAGYEVATIEGDGNVVQRSVQTKLPDLILLDLMLKNLDGKTIAKALKSDSSTRQIPIILISGYPGSQQAAYESGVNGYLEKPFSVDDLMKMVRTYVV